MRERLLESAGVSMTIGQVAAQYPDLWDELCEIRDFDLQGYMPGQELMNQPLGEFIEQERLNTDSAYWWKEYYGNDFQKACIALEALADKVGWTKLSYSGLNFSDCYEMTVEACESFGVPVPPHLRSKADSMDDNQYMDHSLGSNWTDKMRDRFGLDDV